MSAEAEAETEGVSTADTLSKLLSSAVLVFFGSVVASTSTLVERVIVGRLLSSTAYGEYSIAIAIFGLGTTLGTAGFSHGVPRFMARFDDLTDVRGAWLTGLAVSLTVSTLLAVGLLAATPLIAPRLFETGDGRLLYYAFVGLLPVYVAFMIGIGGIRGEENTRYKLLTRDLLYPLGRLALIAGLLAAGVGLVGTGVGYLVAVVAATAVTYVLLNRLLPLRGAFRLHTREMTAFSAPLVVSTVINLLLTRTDTLMLGYLRTSSEVGVYNAAYPLASMMIVVLGAFGYLYLPVASRLDGDEEESVDRIYQVTTKWVYLLVFPMFVTLLTFPDAVVGIVFGGDYAGAGAALSILALGSFTNAAMGRNRETLSALGATKLILVSNAVAFCFNFALNLVLIPEYGHVGAAAASATAYVVLNAVVYGFLRFRFGITPFTRTSLRSFVGLPLLLVPLGFFLRGTLPGTIPAVLLFAVGMSVLTVAVVVAVGALEPEDAILLDFFEDATGLRVPLLRRYVPEE